MGLLMLTQVTGIIMVRCSEKLPCFSICMEILGDGERGERFISWFSFSVNKIWKCIRIEPLLTSNSTSSTFKDFFLSWILKNVSLGGQRFRLFPSQLFSTPSNVFWYPSNTLSCRPAFNHSELNCILFYLWEVWFWGNILEKKFKLKQFSSQTGQKKSTRCHGYRGFQNNFFRVFGVNSGLERVGFYA